MRNLKLEARLKEKFLEVNGNRLNLDRSFFYAGVVSGTSDNPRDIALELKYREMDESSIVQESERIYEFLEQENLTSRIDVNPCPEGSDFPTIALTGDYTAIVYS